MFQYFYSASSYLSCQSRFESGKNNISNYKSIIYIIYLASATVCMYDCILPPSLTIMHSSKSATQQFFKHGRISKDKKFRNNITPSILQKKEKKKNFKVDLRLFV